MHFVGLENFQRIIESRTFWLSLKNTLIITVVSQFFVLVFANILAMALIGRFPRQMARAAADPAAVGRADLARRDRLAVDLQFDLLDHQLDGAAPSAFSARMNGRSGSASRPSPWPRSSSCNVWRIAAARHRDHPRRAHLDPAGHPRRGGGRRRRLLAPRISRSPSPLILPITLVARPVRHHLHLHRHDRGVRADPRRPL